MPFIVNLSSIYTAHPNSKRIQAFVQLCNRYSTSCLSTCSTLFNSLSNHAWVIHQYTRNYNQLIRPYELGAINTAVFLNNLLQIFPFLRDVDAPQEVMDQLNEGESYTDNFALSLLEEAWNKTVDLDEASISRFSMLVAQSQVEPIYLIADTNELNVLKILRLLKRQHPDIAFNMPIDLSVTKSREPLEIAPNIFLCLSYRYQLAKTMAESHSENPHATLSLLKHLIKKELSDLARSDICVISEFSDGSAEAIRLGIPVENAIQADTFFEDRALGIKKTN